MKIRSPDLMYGSPHDKLRQVHASTYIGSRVQNQTNQNKLRGLSLRANFADRECHVVSVTDPHGHILEFLDQSRYFFFQVTTQLYSRG
jgi:hypothetical protein